MAKLKQCQENDCVGIRRTVEAGGCLERAGAAAEGEKDRIWRCRLCHLWPKMAVADPILWLSNRRCNGDFNSLISRLQMLLMQYQ